MRHAQKTQSLPKSKNLNPTEISHLSELLGPAPLLPGESEADYEALKMRIMAAVKPADAIEHLYVRDVIDLQWDLLRFRRLKSHLLSSSAPSGLAALMLPGNTFTLMTPDLPPGSTMIQKLSRKSKHC